MKIYAKQIAPEYQESPLFLDDFFPDNIAVCGNRDFKERCPEVFQRVREALENGELAEALEDVETGGYYSEWYKNATQAINDLLPADKAKYSTKDVHELKRLIAEYAKCSRSDEDSILCAVLSIVTGETWDYKQICGCCQGDWNNVYYPVAQWSYEALKALKDALKSYMQETGKDTLTGTEHKAIYKAVTSSRIDTAALKKAHPEIATQYTRTTETKRFTFA